MFTETPFYDPNLSYQDNYHLGPFGAFAEKHIPCVPKSTPTFFLGHAVNTPFGIPAGPLLNSSYIEAAFRYGYDLCVYKTVRSRYHASHPLPNVLAVHPEGKLSPSGEKVLTNKNYQFPLTITNSFGVPSFEPDIWQPDMAKAVEAAGLGQLMIGSFQGTSGNYAIEKDYALTATLVAETGAPILETNLSCPNEGANQLLCFDISQAERITAAIKNAVPDKPLIMKLAYFADQHQLEQLVRCVGVIVDGFSTINTLPARPVDSEGNPALGSTRKESGICGDAIRWAGVDMVSRLAKLRDETGIEFSIVGVGGVNQKDHYFKFRSLGADAVMSATGAMWDPTLALSIKQQEQMKV